MDRFDYTTTKVLLIGAGNFSANSGFEPIPNIEVNLNLLQQTLSDKEIIGIDQRHIKVSLNEGKTQIIRHLQDIAYETRNKESTLIVYYAGHGQLSAQDYQLYLTSYETSLKYLDAEGIHINEIKKFINRSSASVKILILDCCYSGHALGMMSAAVQKIETGLKGFEGAYMIVSSPEDEPSLFPVDFPEQPTYFTGKLLETINGGIENRGQYCTLEELYQKIKEDSFAENKPQPRQKTYDNTHHLPFFKNRKFIPELSPEEKAWKEVQEINGKWEYLDFIRAFPETTYISLAKEQIAYLDEQEHWNEAIQQGTLIALLSFSWRFPGSRFATETEDAINKLKEQESSRREMKNLLLNSDDHGDASPKSETYEIQEGRRGELIIKYPVETIGIEPNERPAEKLDGNDFEIDSVKFTGLYRPLVLQNNFSNRSLRYAGEPWDSAIKVPFYDPVDMEKRKLPGVNIQFPYLTVSDFLEPHLIRLIYPVNKEIFFDGNLAFDIGDDSKGYLLPLKPLFFEYFDTADLFTVDKAKPRIQMIQGIANSVKVVLTIPVKKEGSSVVFERIYFLSGETRAAEPDERANRGVIVEHHIGLAIFPFIRIETPGIYSFHRVQLINCDRYGPQKDSQFELNFFDNRSGQSISMQNVKNRKNKLADGVSTRYYALNDEFDYIRIRDTRQGGASAIIIPRWRLYYSGADKYHFAVDIGATSTHLEYLTNGREGQPRPFEITRDEIQVGTLFHSNRLEEIKMAAATEIYELVDSEFVPTIMGQDGECGFPQRTAIAENYYYNINNDIPCALADINIPFCYEKRVSKDRIDLNFKLRTNDSRSHQHAIAYLEILVMLMRAKVLFGNGDISGTKLTWFYATNMKPVEISEIGYNWQGLFSKYFHTKTPVTKICGAVAPYFYFKWFGKLRGGAFTPAVAIDIGGRTTTLSVFQSDRPRLMTSFNSGADVFFGDGIRDFGTADNNGLVKKYVPYFEKMLNSEQQFALAAVFRSIQDTKKARDINSFLFSLETNRKTTGQNAYSFNSLLAYDGELKIVFLYFYCAIIFHLAHLMKNKGIAQPTELMFSGTGSKILDIITFEKRDLAKMTELIFSKVYEEQVQPGSIHISMERTLAKEVTCKGGLVIGGDEEVANAEPARTVFSGLEDEGIADLRYGGLNAENKQKIASQVVLFNEFFSSLDDVHSFSNYYNITPASIKLFKGEASKHIRDYLEDGVSYKRKFDGTDENEIVDETLFFYPIAMTIKSLINQLADLSAIV